MNLNYLDFQAYVGVTKHNGGFAATNQLVSLCHIKDAREALNVGSGIGVGSAYIAKRHACRVVGVDVLEKMIEWSRMRAQEEKVEDKIAFQVADVLDLPFDADRFDIVLCESVLAFVEDKPRAIGECVRVTRPGGHVGFSETYWIKEPSPEIAMIVLPARSTLAALTFIVRTTLDDRTLQNALEGFQEYAQQTRYRLLPEVW